MKVMAAEDYKADVSLTSACGQELAELQCGKEQGEEGEHAAVHLSTVLLCLEAGMREEKVKVTTPFQLINHAKTFQIPFPFQVGGRCVSEMQEIRRSLMEDFSVTPELVTSCKVHKNQMQSLNLTNCNVALRMIFVLKAEIKTHCGKDSSKEKHPGETIHCLMKAAMEEDKRRESKDRSKEVTFGRQCEEALNRLLDAAQIASDWKVKGGKCSDLNP